MTGPFQSNLRGTLLASAGKNREDHVALLLFTSNNEGTNDAKHSWAYHVVVFGSLAVVGFVGEVVS